MNSLNQIENIENNNWWFTERKALILDLIKSLNLKPQAKVLDIGCGTGNILNALKSKHQIIGLDELDESIIVNKLKGIKVVKSDATKIPFDNESLDLVLILDVIEHIDDDKKVMSEINRVLKKKGYCLITVPAFQSLWGKDDVLSFHKRRYTKKSLLELSNEFKVVKLFYWNFCLFFPVWLIRNLTSSKVENNTKNLYNVVCTFEENPSKIINFILKNILSLENKLIKKGIKFPFGISMFMLLKKR